MNIINTIRDYVKAECQKPTSKYGFDPFPFHLVLVAKHATALADELGGDKEVILIAAWLHDIGSIISGRDDHHITGAKIAEAKLIELNYPKEKIELVKNCILNHRGSKSNTRNTIEEKIIAEADVISNFDNIAGIFNAAYVYEKLDQAQAQASVRQKLINKWNQLHFEKSKKIVKPKYDAAMLLLE